MKNKPSQFRHRKPNFSSSSSSSTVQKLKLLCSFNGVFQLRQHSGKLRYVGGETRIVSVDRKIGILQLVSKISQLCPNIPSFSIKYQLPESNGCNGGVDDYPLVSIATDEDVRCMIEEYERIETDGKSSARLWVFVCSNGYDGLSQDSSFVFWNSNLVFNGNFGNLALEPKIAMSNIGEIRNCEDSVRKMGLKAQTLDTHATEVRNLNNPFEESACLSQVPVIQMNGCQGFGDLYSSSVLSYTTPMTHSPESENLGCLVPTLDSQLHGLQSVSRDVSVGGQVSMQFPMERFSEGLVNGGGDGGFSNQECAIMRFPYEASNSSVVPSASGLCGIRDWRNGENVVPCTTYCDPTQNCAVSASCSSQLVPRVSPVNSSVTRNSERNNLQSRFRNHRTGGGDIRNHHVTPYCMRNHRNNLPEMGNHYGMGLDGKMSPGKWYPGLGPSSNILKHGQLMRSHYTHLWKPWTNAHEHAWGGMGWMVKSSMPLQISSKSTTPPHPSSNQSIPREVLTEHNVQQTDENHHVDIVGRHGNGPVAESEKPNFLINHLTHQGLHNGVVYESPLPCTVTMNPFSSFREMSSPEELSGNSINAKCKPAAESMVRNFREVHDGCSCVPVNGISNDPNLNREVASMDPQKNGGTSQVCLDACNNTRKDVGCDSMCSLFKQLVQADTDRAVKSPGDDHNAVGTLSGAVASMENLSLYNQSLSSSKGASPPISSSLTSINSVFESSSRCDTETQPNPPDFMEEGCFSSGPPIENLSKDRKSSPIDSASELKKNLSDSKDNRQITPSSLIVDEKAEINGSHGSPKVLGGVCSDLMEFYTNLATRELQTIKNSDLEDIRELGSGTYGTVFYGKWKGSDVAIKRIKPSCFTTGGLKEDRLITDFWKEAHILGQLHHPNVVSFYGVVSDGPVTNLATVTEYMVNGSLKQVLQRKDRTIDRRKRLILAMDAAFGMEYLHEKNIVHFDLKSHNFLVNMKDPQRPVCKIGDMGLSKVKQKTLVSGGVRGTVPWMAPELLTSKKTMVNEKVDVYSFGIVMWELLTGEEPYAHLRPEETIAGIIKGDLRPDIPSWCDPAWRSLMERCWSSDPASRPSFSEIAKRLRTMAAAMNIK